MKAYIKISQEGAFPSPRTPSTQILQSIHDPTHHQIFTENSAYILTAAALRHKLKPTTNQIT